MGQRWVSPGFYSLALAENLYTSTEVCSELEENHAHEGKERGRLVNFSTNTSNLREHVTLTSYLQRGSFVRFYGWTREAHKHRIR